MSAVRNRHGFSLIEAVVALSIVGLIAIAGLSAFSAQVRTTDRARDMLTATIIATERLAELRVAPLNELDPLRDSLRRGRQPPPHDRFQWARTVRGIRDVPGLYDATAEITWEDGRFMLATKLYRPAPRMTVR